MLERPFECLALTGDMSNSGMSGLLNTLSSCAVARLLSRLLCFGMPLAAGLAPEFANVFTTVQARRVRVCDRNETAYQFGKDRGTSEAGTSRTGRDVAGSQLRLPLRWKCSKLGLNYRRAGVH